MEIPARLAFCLWRHFVGCGTTKPGQAMSKSGQRCFAFRHRCLCKQRWMHGQRCPKMCHFGQRCPRGPFQTAMFLPSTVQSMVCIDSDVWTKQRSQFFSAVDRHTTLSADCCRWLHPDIAVYAQTAMDEMHHCWTSMFLLTIDGLP